jgi:pSer/pThr/pTyr-binding forkhead associated (FHA) protein
MILPDAELLGTETPSSRFRLAVANYIGRSEDNQVRLNSDDVSQRHCLIMATGSGFMLKDLQSRNGTFVNGERVEERLLADGDRIQVGSSELTFRMPGSAVGRGVP